MNGWQRLFVVLMVPAALMLIATAAMVYPRTDTHHYAFGCPFESYSFTAEKAREIVANSAKDEPIRPYAGPTDWNKCWAQLRDISSGQALVMERKKFWQGLWYGLLGFIAFCAITYAIGWSIGWVYRGFFPRTN